MFLGTNIVSILYIGIYDPFAKFCVAGRSHQAELWSDGLSNPDHFFWLDSRSGQFNNLFWRDTGVQTQFSQVVCPTKQETSTPTKVGPRWKRWLPGRTENPGWISAFEGPVSLPKGLSKNQTMRSEELPAGPVLGHRSEKGYTKCSQEHTGLRRSKMEELSGFFWRNITKNLLVTVVELQNGKFHQISHHCNTPT